MWDGLATNDNCLLRLTISTITQNSHYKAKDSGQGLNNEGNAAE